MKKVVVSILLVTFVLTAFAAFGVDFGASVYNNTGLDYTNLDGKLDFTQLDIAGLWVSLDIKERLNFYIKGSYAFNYSSENPPKKPHFFDLDALTIKNVGDNPLVVTIGRFSASDFTRYVFDNKIDGISAAFNVPMFSLNAIVGYNGLLFKERSSVIMTRADLLDLSDNNRLFAAPRLVGGFNIVIPDLFLRQDVKLGVWTQLDLRQASELSVGEGRLSSQYYGVGLEGPIVSSLYYTGSFYFETGKAYSLSLNKDSTILSYMGSVGFSYYMDKLLFSKAAIDAIYSSGDGDYKSLFYDGNTEGYSTMFLPISRFVFGKVFSPELGNIFLVKASYSIKPLSFLKGEGLRGVRNIQTEVTAFTYFRSTLGTISEAGVNAGSSSLYLGTEVDGSINGMLLSDLGVFVSGGVFFPNNYSGGVFVGGKDIEAKGSLGIYFEF